MADCDGREVKGLRLAGAASSESNKEGNGGYCFALMSHIFWKGWNHWEIPGKSMHTKATGTAGLTNFAITTNTLKLFLAPDDLQGYADKSISHKVITEVFLDFSSRTRQAESLLYLRLLPSKFVLVCWARPLIVLHATSSVQIHQ